MRRYHLRLPFWIYCGLTALVALAAMNGGSSLLYWVFGVMASSLLVSGLVSGAMMMGLEVTRRTPGHGVAGEALVVRYAVRNRGRVLPAFGITVTEVPGPSGTVLDPARTWLMHVGPRETVVAEALTTARSRGEVLFDRVRIATRFPFGIVGKSITLSQPQRLLVYPRRYALRPRVLDAIVPPGSLGGRITPHAGAGDDFFGLREFRPGDTLRHVAWKRTANRDQLLCIERTRPNPPRLSIVLDLLRPTGALAEGGDLAAARALEEDAISLAASIVHEADLAGFEVGLTLLGVDRAPVPARHSQWHRNRIMAALAEIDLDAPRRRARPLAREVERAGLVVIHPGPPDPSVARGGAWHFSARQLAHLVEPAPAAGPAPAPPIAGSAA